MSINTIIYNPAILEELKVAIPSQPTSNIPTVVLFDQGQMAVNTSVQQYILTNQPAPNIIANRDLLITVAYSCQSSVDGQVVQLLVGFDGEAQQTFKYNISNLNYTNNISCQFFLQSPTSAPQVQITVNTFDGAESLSTSANDYYNVSIVQY